MSIAVQIVRIKNLRDRLTDILQRKNIISAGSHTLEEDVEAVENLTYTNYNLQNKTINLGSSAIPQIFPDSGYDGLQNVYLPVNNSEILPEYIVRGNTIMGINGTANTVVNIKKIYWQTPSFINSKTLVLKSSEASCYPIGSFTPGDPLPYLQVYINEFLCYRYGYINHNITKNEANVLLKPKDHGQNLAYLNNANGSLVFEYFSWSYNNNYTELTITLNGENDYFIGNYCSQIFY